MDVQHAEAVVVGGGPIGIETAIELRRRGIDASVLEAGMLGQTISWWAPQTRWFSSNDRISIAGVPLHTVDQSKASREEYLNYLRGVVDQFQVPVQTFAKVRSIEPIGDCGEPRWQLSIQSNRGWEPQINSEPSGRSVLPAPDRLMHAKAIILAIGGTDFPNRLNIPGESLPHVDGYLREVHSYHGRRVMIVGGRNSAVEAAIRLHRVGAKVSLSYHGESLPTDGIKYWLRPEIEGLIRSGSVQAWFRSKVSRIETGAVVLETKTSTSRSESVRIPADDVLTLIGYQQNQDLFRSLDILSADTNPKPLFDPATMQTPRPGIYLAGTAVGGTQSSKYQVFLENCHDHSVKIADHLSGRFGRTVMEEEASSVTRSMDSRESLRRRIGLQPES